MLFRKCFAIFIILSTLLAGCSGSGPSAPHTGLRVLAVETFLADMAQNVAGERIKVDSLLSPGQDAHSFEPGPSDVAKVASCDVLIVNGSGLETFLNK